MSDPSDYTYYETVYDAEGKPVRRLRERIREVVPNDSGFTTFDTSHGHCGLCGALGCHGSCFK